MSKATPNNWTRVAAQKILSNLMGRKGVGNELEACDDDILSEIEDTIVGIIEQANKEATDHANRTFP